MELKKGFSLLEVVVYLALLGLVGVTVIESTLSVYKVYVRTRVERRLNLNGDIAIETMVRSIREATSTDLGVSVFGSNPGTLRVGGKTFSRNISNNTLQVDDGSGAVDITSDAGITSLIFYRDATTTSEIIKIEMAISAGQGSFIKTENFFGGVVLRGKY